jgi:hypothetical protein
VRAWRRTNPAAGKAFRRYGVVRVVRPHRPYRVLFLAMTKLPTPPVDGRWLLTSLDRPVRQAEMPGFRQQLSLPGAVATRGDGTDWMCGTTLRGVRGSSY